MKRKMLSICLAAALTITGCSGKEKSEKPSDKPKTAEQNAAPPKREYENTYPLTGIGTDKAVNQRAVAVMINNHPKARQQSGLSKADIIYEILAEGEVTRFLAIFQSEKPDQIGPVRSARDYYMELAKGFDSLYILHGYSPEAKKLLASGYIDHLNGLQYDGTLFKRASFRKAPHNSYISYGSIEKGAAKNSFKMDTPPKQLKFLTEDQVNDLTGEGANEAQVSYNASLFDVTYKYDSKLQKYKRYTNNELTSDYETRQPVLLDNLLVIEAQHRITDNKGRRDVDLHAGGTGYLLQKGKAGKVTWQLKDGIIVPFINGHEAGLVPGKTWVNVVPDKPGIDSRVRIKP